jgi:RimJ/RimL family protein N-acetyltransferase
MARRGIPGYHHPMQPFAILLSLKTDRLLLRAPNPADAVRLFESYTGDMEVTRYLPWVIHRNLAEVETMIEHCEQDHASGWDCNR